MFIVTHALLPVCLGVAGELASLASGRGHLFPPWGLAAIGVFGALSDLCSPHLSLEARASSLSHTLVFLAALAPVSAVTASFFPAEGRWRLAAACWLAAALHLAADAISGGIPWLLPWRTEMLGGSFIPPGHWLWYDAGFLLLAGIGLRLRPHAEARGMKA